MSLTTQRAFETANLESFRKKSFPITCVIPNGREPEFGIRLSDIDDAFILEDEFRESPQVRLLEPPTPHDGVLISLAQDVVDSNGMPVSTLYDLNVESRRRFSMNPNTGDLVRFDVSFKDAGKTSARREWEGAAYDLHTGHEEAMQKIAADIPEITEIDPSAFRIMGPCIASRSSNYHRFLLADCSAMLTVETNDDACVFSTPHADQILGYRFEREPEITAIHLPKRSNTSDEALHVALDKGLDEIKTIINSSKISAKIKFEEMSKGGEIVRRVSHHYDSGSMYQGMSGRNAALLQNITAQDYYGKASALCRLASTIPSSHDIATRKIPANVVTSDQNLLFIRTQTASPLPKTNPS